MRGLYKPSCRLLRLCQSQSIRQQAHVPIARVQPCRYSSSPSSRIPPPEAAASIDIEAIRAEMLAREPQYHVDTMYTLNSARLTTALYEFLPEECLNNQLIPESDVYKNISHTLLNNYERPDVPAGHHFVYFPLSKRGEQLWPDGTDPYHGPLDTPFTRRMWAGGSIEGFRGLKLDDGPAVCVERIVDVKAQGLPGDERIYVEVLREYASHTNFGRNQFRSYNNYPTDPLTERRTLVFMRELSDERKKANLEQKQRIVKPPSRPDYSVTMTPTPTLLFQYSALSYNAHRIHFDRSYCREAEGHKDLLVHGPLSLTLILSVLQSQLAREGDMCEFIDSISYRHLAPLYVNQPMRICVKLQEPTAAKHGKEDLAGKGQHSEEGKKEKDEEQIDTTKQLEAGRNKWNLWVENQEGSLCVKGTAKTMKHRTLSETG